MRIAILASASAAIAVAVTLFDPTPAEAAVQRRVVRKVQSTTVRNVQPRTLQRIKVHHVPKLRVEKKTFTKTPLMGTGSAAAFANKGNPQLMLRGLPIHKVVAGNTLHVGRVGLPQNLRPKLTLTHAPKVPFQHRMAPFVQRHWKKAFFWVAVAGIGYLTIPELYYDRFVTYVSVDDPDYDGCINLLSLAALEEEEELVRVRRPMPASATYRYSAPVAPEPVSSGPSCSFEPFIERNWSRPFVWVQIPKIGNVSVPEDYYDRFYGFVGAAPPNYPAACAVLVEAAAADTVATTSLDYRRPNLQ